MPFALHLKFKVLEVPAGGLFEAKEEYLASQYDSISGNGWVLRLGKEMEPAFSFAADQIVAHCISNPPLPPPQASPNTAVVPIPLKSWIELTVTHDGTTASIYLNGHLSGSAPGKLNQPGVALVQGGSSWDASRGAFKGQLTDLVVEDRLLLQDEIQRALWPPDTIRLSAVEDIEECRLELSDYIWGDPGMPTRSDAKLLPYHDTGMFDSLRPGTLRNIQSLTIGMDYGLRSVAYLFTPALSNNRLFIYHAGHDGGPFFEDIFVNNEGQRPGLVISRLLREHYNVLVFGMPIWALDQKHPTVDVPGRGKVTLQSHENLFSYLEKPLRFFFEPLVVALNTFQNSARPFEHIFMMGLSGGGWTTTLYAALDVRIEQSFPVAGSIPNYLRIGFETLGDAEQDDLGLYRLANYCELYVMGSVGPGRSQLQILNRHDSCCFYGDRYVNWVEPVRQRAGEIGGRYDFFLDESHRDHKISTVALDRIMAATLS